MTMQEIKKGLATSILSDVPDFELMPDDSRKSFYGKAIVRDFDETRGLVLFSYNTPVAAYIMGKFYRLWDGYSATTMRHVNAFASYCGVNGRGKSWWDSLEVIA